MTRLKQNGELFGIFICQNGELDRLRAENARLRAQSFGAADGGVQGHQMSLLQQEAEESKKKVREGNEEETKKKVRGGGGCQHQRVVWSCMLNLVHG